MARMLYLMERLWFSSTLTLATLTAPAFSRATSSSSGAIILHGPHHSAQKSTITGLSSCVSSRSKLDSSSLITVEFSMALRKVSPNLNNQNQGRNSEQYPPEQHWFFFCRRDSTWRVSRTKIWRGDERLSIFHLSRGGTFG